MKKKLYKIGITGGIGSGKSKLLQYLAQTQPRIYTVNLDLFGHSIYTLNPVVLRNVGQIFGQECVERGTVNRGLLGKKVFQNEERLRTLRSLMSPEIKRLLIETIAEVQEKQYDVIAVEGAVLIEAMTYTMFDELWVTFLDKEQAVKRVLKRNPELGEGQVRARVYSQIEDAERVKYASFHYDTSDQVPFEENKKLINQEIEKLRARGILQL